MDFPSPQPPQERVLRAGAAPVPSPKSLAAGPHGVSKQALSDRASSADAQNQGVAILFIHSLAAGPEELKPFPKRSRKKVFDTPQYLCYLSCRNGSYECSEPKLINPERAMESTRNREAEILTTDDTDERGSGTFQMRALRAATAEAQTRRGTAETHERRKGS